MYTADRSKEIAAQNRSVEMVFFYIERQVSEELNLGRRFTTFLHEGLSEPSVREEVIKRLKRLGYVVAAHVGVTTIIINPNKIDIYWDQ